MVFDPPNIQIQKYEYLIDISKKSRKKRRRKEKVSLSGDGGDTDFTGKRRVCHAAGRRPRGNGRAERGRDDGNSRGGIFR